MTLPDPAGAARVSGVRSALPYVTPWLTRCAGPIFLLLVVVLFYWKLVLTHQYTWLDSPDLSDLILPWYQFQAGEWHAHRFPMWDPNGWAGLPLFGQAEPGSAYPLNWLFFLAPLKNGWIRNAVLNWYYVLVHYLVALSCYAFCRDLGRSRRASILGGCVFALGGYVASTDWPQKFHCAVWVPLVLLYLFRTARRQKPLVSALLSGFFLGVTWLSGHHQASIFLTIAIAMMWTWLCFRERRFDRQMALWAVLSLALSVLTSGFQTLPTAEYGRLAVRWGGGAEPLHFNESVPYRIHGELAMKPLGLLGVFIPGIDLNSSNPYVGIAAFALAILGGILAWKDPRVRWLASLALGGILFALGPNSLLHGVIYALVPLVEKARVPEAATLIFAIGLAPLVAFGVDLIPVPDSLFWSRRASSTLWAVGAFLAMASLLFFVTRVTVVISEDRMMITALSAVLFAAMLTALRSGNLSSRAAAFAMLALVLFELANVTNYWRVVYGEGAPENSYLRSLGQHSDLAEYVKGRGLAARVLYDSNEIRYNIGDWYGIETVNSFGASVTANLWNHQIYTLPVENFLGIRYYFGRKPMRPEQREVFQGQSGVKVFENADALPRVWSVHESFSVADAKRARSTLANPQFHPLRQAFFIGNAPRLSPCAGALDDEVQLASHLPNRVTISATMVCPGMVILTDNWFPGWYATVDGKSAEISEAYGFVRGVQVGAGRHTIVMRYRPMSLISGGLMTLSAAGIVLVALWRTRRRRPIL